MMNQENECRPAAQRPVETVLDGDSLNDLKACPFCLSDFLDTDTNSHNSFCVFCHQCHCIGPPAPTPAIALEYWNNHGEIDYKVLKERDLYLW